MLVLRREFRKHRKELRKKIRCHRRKPFWWVLGGVWWWIVGLVIAGVRKDVVLWARREKLPRGRPGGLC